MGREAVVLLVLGALSPARILAQILPCDAPALVSATRLTLRHLGAPAGDDRLRFTGALDLSHAVDPAVNGVRFILHVPFDSPPLGEPPLDATVPGGSSWTHRSRSWLFRDPQGRIGGLRRILIRQKASGTLTVSVDARGTYAVDTSSLPVSVVLVLDEAATDGCAVARFSASRCPFDGEAHRLACIPMPAIVPCTDPTPNALVACDAQNAASAEEALFAATGWFLTGVCSALPGFVPSPFVVCTMAGLGNQGYEIATAHPMATVACHWSSRPPPGQPPLVCM